MAKDGNTFAKRQRETLKRQKAEDKRNRKKHRKENPDPVQGDDTGSNIDTDQPPADA